jgi:serine/threonine protein phosphatase PrpC
VNFLRDLFRQNKSEQLPAATVVETAPLPPVQVESPAQPDLRKMEPPQLVAGIGQSVGMQRDHNEDTLYAMQAILADGGSDMPFGIFVVADGMGGHLNGEVASGTAARTISDYLVSHFYLPFLKGKSGDEQESIHEIMEEGTAAAQRAVLANAPGGGTTLTAALVMGDQVTLAHVGDTRAYFLYPDGRCQVMTQDHSLVRRLQDLGQIDEREASTHPQRNVLYRALGQSEPFRPDINTYNLPHQGYLLLCSDGLWGSVPDAEISRIVLSAENPPDACQQLMDAANAAGGPDNISAILIQYLG